MPAEPIQYWHRTKRTVETEQIYGERWLRWIYETSLGRLALWLVVRRAFFFGF
jgi:phosphatidylserine decarboxylase